MREEQNKQRLIERYDNRKHQADEKRETIQIRWEQKKMVKRIARNNQQQLKRIERLQTRDDAYIKRQREDDKLEIERRRRKKEFYLYQFQTKWSLSEIKILYEEKKNSKWEIGAGMRGDVALRNFRKGDESIHKIKNQVREDDELDEDDPYFGLTKEEIAELKRLDEESHALDLLEDEKHFEKAVEAKPVAKPTSFIPEDDLTESDLAHYDDVALKTLEKSKVAAAPAKPPEKNTKKVELDEDDEELKRLEAEEAELRKLEAEKTKKSTSKSKKQESEEEIDTDEELRRLDEEEAELKRLEEEEKKQKQQQVKAPAKMATKPPKKQESDEEIDTDEELRRLEEEEAELRRLEEEEARLRELED